jgi:hypothetical protein
MRSKLILGVLALVAVSLLAGCASLQKGTSFNGRMVDGQAPAAHYSAKNWGIYLLWIPLLTGNTNHPGRIVNTTLLSDTVNVDSLGDMITHQAQTDGATGVNDIVSSRSSLWLPPFLVLFYKSATMSATGVH